MTNDSKPRTHADGIPVYCTYDEIVPIAKLKPNPLNPNKHPQEQIEALGGIIRKSGWRNNITISTRSGLIVKGHGRLLAAQLEELKEVPVEYQHYATEAEEFADLTADNRIAELAEIDRSTDFAEGGFDPFGGSGTTMMAAEAKNQKSYIMEISPSFVDVIVKRYIRATGSDNVICIRNGEQLSRDEIAGIFEINAASVEGGEAD